ncbi:hypothetical protein ACFLQL_01565 [Verrucomicrobiota bacterium]
MNKIQFKIILTGKLSNNEGALSEIDLCVEAPIEKALATFKNTIYFSFDSLLKQFSAKLNAEYAKLEQQKQKVTEDEKRTEEPAKPEGSAVTAKPAPAITAEPSQPGLAPKV